MKMNKIFRGEKQKAKLEALNELMINGYVAVGNHYENEKAEKLFLHCNDMGNGRSVVIITY